MRINRYASACAIALVVLYCVGASAVNSNEIEHAGLLHHIQTDVYQYTLSDSIPISYTVTNVTGETMDIYVSYIGCPIWIYVYNSLGVLVWSDPYMCADEAGVRTLAPAESFSLNPTWDLVNPAPWPPIDEPGVYTMKGRLKAVDPAVRYTIELQIQIVDPPSAVPEGPADGPSTWSTIKALYR